MDTRAPDDSTEVPGPHVPGRDASRASQPPLCHPRTVAPPQVDHVRNRFPIANCHHRLRRSFDPADTDGMFIRYFRALSNQGFSYSYRVAKAAQNMLSVCLSEEFAPKGVQVAAVHPGQFMSSTAASDADMSAGEAARELVQWIESWEGELEVQLIQPGRGPLPW